MLDVILDTLLDMLKLIPFLFIAFLIIELIEHKFSKKTEQIITKSGKFGPSIGAVLGAIPQCGFSVIATNFYITRIITLGTLISIYLSTSDEMIPILISHNFPLTNLLYIVGIKILIGLIFGTIIDLFIRNSEKKEKSDFHICDETHCECEKSIIKSTVVHTLKTILFIGIISFIINIILYYVPEYITENIFINNKYISPFIASLIGLIPNCAASITLTELYVSEIISFGTLISGLLTGSGVALLVLIKSNKDIKENLKIVSLIYFIGVIMGLIFNIINFAI